MKVLSFRDLRDKGIPFTRQHIHKLVQRGEFPRPVKIGDKTNAWDEPEIDEYLKNRRKRRNEAEMKMAPSG
jgi:prophage regulatory protein